MKSYKTFLESLVEPKEKAIRLLDAITDSSRSGSEPDSETKEYLHQTVLDSSYTLYRGIALDDGSSIQGLDIGDSVPSEFVQPNGAQLFIHATKDVSIAESYAQGKGYGLVFKIELDSRYVICDLTNLDKIVSHDDLNDDFWKYIEETKEVLVDKDALMTTSIVDIYRTR